LKREDEAKEQDERGTWKRIRGRAENRVYAALITDEKWRVTGPD